MNTMSHLYSRLPRAGSTALLVASFAIGGAEAAREVGSIREGIVALAFDAGSHSLIKAYPRALYASRNEGHDWERVALPRMVERARVASVAISGHSKGLLYVAGPGLGVLRSADGGRSWDAKNSGLPSKNVVALTVHADQPATVYAYIAAKGIFRSEDGGDHWRLMDAGPRDGILQFVHSNMPGSMQTGWLFAATAKGVGRSMDCFCGWRDAGALGRKANAVAYDLREPKRVYVGTADGLFVSDNGGEQWSPIRSPGRITALVATSDGRLIAAADPATLFRSTDHGLTWRRLDE